MEKIVKTLTIILSSVFLSLGLSADSNVFSLSDFLFESQDFLFNKSTHDIYLKDRAKFWIKDTTQNSQYYHRSADSMIFAKYLGEKRTRVTKLVKGRPSRLRSIVVSGDHIESVYLCEIRLAPGFFYPSGVKSFHCHFMTSQTCEELNKIKMKTPVFSFIKSLTQTLPDEKKAFMDVYIPSFKFLLGSQEVSESDLQIQEYRDSYRSLCMGLRLQIGHRVRFKYDQDADYEAGVCLDHAPSLITNKAFELTHKKYCEYFIKK